MNNFANNTEIKNIKAKERLDLIPKELAYGLGSFLIVLGVLLIYFWYRAKERRKIYSHMFDGDLKATSINSLVNKPPKYSIINIEKTFKKYPIPNFRIRNMHLVYLYSAVVLFIIGVTMVVGKPLGIM